MPKPKLAKLRNGSDVLVENVHLELGKTVSLNIAGELGNGSTGVRLIKIHVRVFSRKDGRPNKPLVIEKVITVPNITKKTFELDLGKEIKFTPRHKTVHSLRVFAWDVTNAVNAKPAKLDDIRTHVVRVRVQ